MPSLIAFEIVGFGVGLLLGSFLNVCISRLPAHESVVRPGSRCMTCGHPVRWFDNVPVLSWIVLRGRCRDCGAKISWRYPAVELAVAGWFAFAGALLWHAWTVSDHGYIDTWRSFDDAMLLTSKTLAIAILGFLLIGLIVMDWQTQRLPNAFTLTGIGLGFVLLCIQAAFLPTGAGDIVLNTTHQLRLSSPGSFTAHGNVFLTGTEGLVMGRLAAIAGSAFLLLTVRWVYKAIRKQDGMGLGDVKLLAMIAAFLGFTSALLALFAGVMAASAYGVLLLARKRASRETRLAFGSFLAGGGLLAALWGRPLLNWYTSLLR